MLFRPVYIRAPPLAVKLPSPVKQTPPPPPPPPPRSPTPPPVEPEPEPEPEPEQVPKSKFPILVSGKGVTAVYPKEATMDVLSGKVDYFLVDERGLTLFERKPGSRAVVEEEVEPYEVRRCRESCQRLTHKNPNMELECMGRYYGNKVLRGNTSYRSRY